MKQVLPLFIFAIFLAFPSFVFATISFNISNPVREGDYYIVDTTLSGISSASAYVFGVFTNTSSPNYFGSTWGQKESWVDYQSFSKDFIVSNFPILQKDISQKIWVKPNYKDSGYKGPGEYFLKLRRYTGASDNSAGDSNTLTILLSEPQITPTSSPTQTSTPTSAVTSTVTPSSSPTPTKTPTPTPTKTPAPSISKTPSPAPSNTTTPTFVIASVTKQSSPSTTPSVIASLVIEPKQSQISTPSSILGTATSSSVIASEARQSSLSTTVPELTSTTSSELSKLSSLKYTFIFGVIISVISGGILYFRHRNG